MRLMFLYNSTNYCTIQQILVQFNKFLYDSTNSCTIQQIIVHFNKGIQLYGGLSVCIATKITENLTFMNAISHNPRANLTIFASVEVDTSC